MTKKPYAALRSHVVETRLEWRTQPIYSSNEHSVALQFWMIVQVGVFFFSNAKVRIASVDAPGSARLGQVGGHVGRGHAVLDLGVGDGAVFLPQVQPQLTLVAEVQVAFLTLEKEEKGKKW